jgi:hypothetical protein
MAIQCSFFLIYKELRPAIPRRRGSTIRPIRSRTAGANGGVKENHGYFGLKGAQVSDVRRMQGCHPRLRTNDCNKSWRSSAKAIRFALDLRARASPKAGELDEVAARNGDIQAFIPDQGHRPPAAGRSLRSGDRRRTDRRPVVSLLPPHRHHDHGSRRAAAPPVDRDAFHQFGRPRRRAAGRRGRIAMNEHHATTETTLRVRP